jgi:hypothetical protein
MGASSLPRSQLATGDAKAFIHGVRLVLCQQSVSTLPSRCHAQQDVAPTRQSG